MLQQLADVIVKWQMVFPPQGVFVNTGRCYLPGDRLTLHVLLANYTNKHVTFNKGQCIGHIEPSIDHMWQTTINSLTTQKMIDEHVQPETFTPPIHTLPSDVRKSPSQLPASFKSQFAQDETRLGQLISPKCILTQVTQNLSPRGHIPSL